MSLRDWFIAPAPAPPEDVATRPTPDSGRPRPRDTASDWAPPAGALPARSVRVDTASDHAAARPVGSAAVIGRPGEAEPVAAGIALALRGGAPAAAVIVVGEPSVPSADGGTRAARRLAARL